MLRASKIQQYLNTMQAKGFDDWQVLEGSGVTAADLRRDAFKLDIPQIQVIIRNMLSLTDNAALGFDMGARITPSDMGVVGQGMIAAPTFRHTIQIWSSYAPTLFGSLIQIALKEEAELWRMDITVALPAGIYYQFCLEEYLAIVAHMGERMLGNRVTYGGLEISYPAPLHQAKYQELFECPVVFDAPRTCISVVHPKLDDFIQTRDEYLFPIYQHYCKRQSSKAVHGNSCAHSVYNYLLKTLGRTPDIEDMAREQLCSASTIRRRLKDEGLTFRDLRNDFRQDFAQEYLKTTTLTAKEIAYLLGYHDTKPFLRAFKLWTGMTVGEYSRSFGLG
ncbi:MAG: AraC family transcriptional regulator [Lacipirellulaceae bacterium]|uniref:AraC family transcriptional regulator n=1 Tax=Marinobacter salarius TaxID=1420917 RepID=UPI0032EE7C11